jgi:hypothetical protein
MTTRNLLMAAEPESTFLRTRRALAVPFYAVALVFAFTSSLVGWVAAKIAGDPF